MNFSIAQRISIRKLNQSSKFKHLDFAANLGEIVEAPARQVAELAPLGTVVVVVSRIPRTILEHQDERPPRANVASAREEVAADQGLEHARLAAALAADHRHLWKRNLRKLGPHRSQNVLELVHDWDH